MRRYMRRYKMRLVDCGTLVDILHNIIRLTSLYRKIVDQEDVYMETGHSSCGIRVLKANYVRMLDLELEYYKSEALQLGVEITGSFSEVTE